MKFRYTVKNAAVKDVTVHTVRETFVKVTSKVPLMMVFFGMYRCSGKMCQNIRRNIRCEQSVKYC